MSIKKKGQGYYRFTDHACGRCLGRVMAADLPDGMTEFVCSNCGCCVIGSDVTEICACGSRRPDGAGNLVNASLRCCVNENPNPALPALIVVKYFRETS
ncbi:hypothetical protein [Morganella phage Mecenats66]|nr:hypothetical protein [Morganella phage Mecenats66]